MLLVVCLSVLLVPGVSAYNLSQISIFPTGALTPNTAVEISGLLDFPATSGGTFPSANNLVLTTDLKNPTWTYTLILDGVENPRNPIGGQMLNLSGFKISYPLTVKESIRFTLEGNAPTVDQTWSKKTLICIQEIDAKGNAINASAVCYNATMVTPTNCCGPLPSMRAKLQNFRSHIDEKVAMGVNTSMAETKYIEAQKQLDSARARTSGQYIEAFADLNTAQAAIDEGEIALDKAWAETEVANAQIPVDNTDVIIRWFKSNSSTANEPALDQIIAKRDIAVNYLSEANHEITNGSYTAARTNAREAYKAGNESYNDALRSPMSRCIGCRKGPLLTPEYFFAGAGTIAIAIVAIFLWKKRG